MRSSLAKNGFPIGSEIRMQWKDRGSERGRILSEGAKAQGRWAPRLGRGLLEQAFQAGYEPFDEISWQVAIEHDGFQIEDAGEGKQRTNERIGAVCQPLVHLVRIARDLEVEVLTRDYLGAVVLQVPDEGPD